MMKEEEEMKYEEGKGKMDEEEKKGKKKRWRAGEKE